MVGLLSATVTILLTAMCTPPKIIARLVTAAGRQNQTDGTYCRVLRWCFDVVGPHRGTHNVMQSCLQRFKNACIQPPWTCSSILANKNIFLNLRLTSYIISDHVTWKEQYILATIQTQYKCNILQHIKHDIFYESCEIRFFIYRIKKF